MAISRVTGQSNTNGGAASTSVTFTYPSAPTEGNLLVARFSYRVSGTTVTNSPSGWTKAGSTYSNGNINTELWWKKAGASEPTGHTWTLSASVKSAGNGEEFNSTLGWPANPVGVATGSSGATGTTGLSTGTTSTSNAPSGAEILVLGCHACDTNATWSGHTGTNVTIAETVEVSSTGGAGSTRNTTSSWSGIASSNAAFSAAADLSASNNWAALIQTFYENTNVVDGNPTMQAFSPTAITVSAPSGSAGVDASASGSVGTVTLTAPSATTTADASASGSVGTITLTAPSATLATDADVSGTVGTVTISTPTGSAGVDASASGSVGTVTLTTPSGSATGTADAAGTVGTVTLTAAEATTTADASAAGSVGTVTLTAPEATLTTNADVSPTLVTITITTVAGSAVGAGWAYDQQLFPDAIVSMSGLNGLVTYVQEDVETPDANWLTVA